MVMSPSDVSSSTDMAGPGGADKAWAPSNGVATGRRPLRRHVMSRSLLCTIAARAFSAGISTNQAPRSRFASLLANIHEQRSPAGFTVAQPASMASKKAIQGLPWARVAQL